MSNQSTASGSEAVECVGSLLVHTSDMQELSDHNAVQAELLPAVNLQKRVTAVGTLLVNQNDLDSSSGSGSGSNNNPNAEENDSPSIVRRITKALQGPAPDDAEADTWAD